jgi:hypothetical protein
MVEALCYKPDGNGFIDIFFFNLPNPSGHSRALGFTEPLTEMSIRKYGG